MTAILFLIAALLLVMSAGCVLWMHAAHAADLRQVTDDPVRSTQS